MTNSLTKGNEARAIVLFSLPMIAGNFLQQLYNVADTLIVGRFLGSAALAAVGSAYALMVLLTSIILGLCMGSGVCFAQMFGAQRTDDLKTCIFNAFSFILCITFAINVLSFALLDRIVVWLHIPPEALPYTTEYLHIIFVGMGFVSIYNFVAAVLRSIGNTVMPLVFLGVAAGINIVLDIVFVVYFNSGIAGAAWATVIAQGVSAAAISIYFFVHTRYLCPERRHCRLDKNLLRFVMSNSVLAGVQQSIMNFGILMIQGLVNSFGVAATAAFAAVVKIDAFAYMPAQDFGNAFSTFVAQNYGAGQYTRIRRGTRASAVLSSAFCAAASLAVCVFARPLMLLFVQPSETEIIRIGMQYLRIEGACYIGIGLLFLYYGFFRGLGKGQMSIVLTVVSLGTRVLLAFILAAVPGIGLLGVWISIPVGWLLADLLGFFRCKNFFCENT